MIIENRYNYISQRNLFIALFELRIYSSLLLSASFIIKFLYSAMFVAQSMYIQSAKRATVERPFIARTCLQSCTVLPRLSLWPNRLIRRTLLNESCVRYALMTSQRDLRSYRANLALISKFDSESNTKTVSNRSPIREHQLF